MNEIKIEYIEYEKKDLIVKELYWQKLGLQQTATGYGSKLSTRYMLKIGNRLYRVYCACYSNSGSCYIIKKGKMLHLRGW
jgi:hypothetical protein